MKNYVSHAIDALNKKNIPLLKKLNWKEDILSVLAICEQLKKSIHFSMPDGGKILDDKFRGLHGQELRLPFPMITIEYFQNIEKVPLKEGQAPSRDRLLHAIEKEIDGEIWIFLFCAYRGVFDWEISPLGAAIPTKWDQLDSRGVSKSFKVLPDFLNTSDTQMVVKIQEEVAEECIVLLEFLEALSCKNVSHSPMGKVSKVMNDMRVRKGKTPFYETRELIINSGVSSGKVSDVVNIPTGSYTPKRQHLRRGHIRRLEKGNVWVNSCIVGSAELGVINKTYKIAA